MSTGKKFFRVADVEINWRRDGHGFTGSIAHLRLEKEPNDGEDQMRGVCRHGNPHEAVIGAFKAIFSKHFKDLANVTVTCRIKSSAAKGESKLKLSVTFSGLEKPVVVEFSSVGEDIDALCNALETGYNALLGKFLAHGFAKNVRLARDLAETTAR